MGIFDFLRGGGIDKGIEEYRATDRALLLDVRSAQEYSEGHIPGSVNLPLQNIGSIKTERDTPIFVYCLSGGRSQQAVSALKQMGYTNLKNIGGISSYRGKVEY